MLAPLGARLAKLTITARAALAGLPLLAFAGLPVQAFELELPLACSFGDSCFLQQYADHDAGPGAADAFCSPRTYDGHKGTDFRLPDLETMWLGVEVLAAAPGRVRATRDGMPDISRDKANAPDISGRECGNGVVVDHADGWSTQYCHLAEGSVRVSSGETVAAGDEIGRVGLSGDTVFPHLHLSLRRNDVLIDPFNGRRLDEPCTTPGRSLWSATSGVTYQPGAVMSAGFQTDIPEYSAINSDSPHAGLIASDARQLVFWGHAIGLERGDVLNIKFTDPDGTVVVEDSYRMPKDRATEYRAIGRKRRGEAWATGVYLGQMELVREGRVISRRGAITTLR